MNRRSLDSDGCVRFPTQDIAWRSTGEGGMLVKLVVCDDREFEQQFGVCAGVHVTDVLSEALIGDDRRPPPEPPASYDSPEAVVAEQIARANWESYHYPRTADPEATGVERYLSRTYLAALVLGSTGWSGHNDTQGYWACQYEDLTEAGQALYQQIASLYPGCTLHLLTFLDT